MVRLNNTKIRKEFYPSLKDIIINPYYFARKGLYESIIKCSAYISGKILDVGCGDKPYKHLFNYTEYLGLDFDKGGSNDNIHADYFYDGTSFPFDEDIFDSCICTQVFEHVFEPNNFLDEIHRVLKPEGHLLLTVPFVWDEHEQPYDYGRYSSFGLVSILEKHGFKIIKHLKTNNDIRVIIQLFNTYLVNIFQKIDNKYLKLTLKILTIGFMNMLGSIIYRILPKNDNLYLDNIVVAMKERQ